MGRAWTGPDRARGPNGPGGPGGPVLGGPVLVGLWARHGLVSMVEPTSPGPFGPGPAGGPGPVLAGLAGPTAILKKKKKKKKNQTAIFKI